MGFNGGWGRRRGSYQIIFIQLGSQGRVWTRRKASFFFQFLSIQEFRIGAQWPPLVTVALNTSRGKGR